MKFDMVNLTAVNLSTEDTDVGRFPVTLRQLAEWGALGKSERPCLKEQDRWVPRKTHRFAWVLGIVL